MTPGEDLPKRFVTTRWDLVFAAARDAKHPGHFAGGREALEKLCSIYRAPIVAFCSHQLRRVADAEDIAQGFLSSILQGKVLSTADRQKGRFRNLILVSLKRFVADLVEREKAAKRGGGVEFVSLEDSKLAGESVAERSSIQPELLFDFEWAKSLVQESLTKLRARQKDPRIFEYLEPFLTAELTADDGRRISRSLSMTPEALNVRLHRFREIYRSILREEVAKTVGNSEELDAELSHLRAVMIQCQLVP